MKNIPLKSHYQLDEINLSIKENPEEYIKSIDRDYHAYIKNVANSVAAVDTHKIVMLSGPSGSGKTTTAHFMQKYMNDLGVETVCISLDNFYLGRNNAPKLPDGRFDYETIDALNVPLMQECIFGLINRGYCEMPEFDFLSGMPKDERVPIRLPENGIAIFEGIHALNPLIVKELPSANIYKVYVSVHDGIYEGDKVLLSPREIRLSRRLIRDSIFRNSGAKNTLHMWTGVVMGEDKYLFPYKDTADISINSLHSFEPAIMRNRILELLSDICPGDENYHIAAEIYDDFKKFLSVSIDMLPKNSLIHEFVG